MVGAEEEQQLKNGAPDSPFVVTWSVDYYAQKKTEANRTGEQVCW